MKRFPKTFLVLPILFIATIFAVSVLVGNYFSKFSTNKVVVDTDKTQVENQIKPRCTRTTRLQNDPQYDRALSLIQQRLQQHQADLAKSSFKEAEDPFIHFPPDLVNCIFIKEENLDKSEGVEGYFVFHSELIRDNYFPINISDKYSETDDITTALLIAHEMTHVQQYLDELEGKEPLDCISAEVEAFIAQDQFFGSLNIEELTSVNARIVYNDYLHPQLQMLADIRGIWLEFVMPACGFGKFSCEREVLRVKLRPIIENNEYYKKQCGLK